MKGFFVTGTNTGVGKTHVGAMVVRSLVDAGYRVGVCKPVESGCDRKAGQLVAADAQALWEAAGRPGQLMQVCPQRFEAALAPPQAAELENAYVDAKLLRTCVDHWHETSDIVLVEGAGGLMSPLSGDDYNLNLAADLNLPLIIVAANELGVINATLQTIITARALAPRLAIAGVVLNQTAELADDESVERNADQLSQRCDVPLLATVAYRQSALASAVDWLGLAGE
ncbi:MAG: dethiobiotin synthase [Planctomycetota bacterium]